MNTKKQKAFIAITPEIDAYLKSIRKYQPLSKEEENLMFDMYHSGDPAAKEKAIDTIIKSNQKFIFSLAKDYAKGDSEKVLDYVSEGNIGCLNAIEKFDRSRGFKFISFAVWSIRQAMTNYAQTSDQFIKKSNGAKIGNNVIKFKHDFYQKNNREPNLQEIKDFLAKKGIIIKDDHDLDDVFKHSIDSVWADETTFESNPHYIQNSAVNNDYEKEIEIENNKSVIERLLDKLDERSALVVKQLYGIGYENAMDIEVVAEHLGLTTTRVGQIKNAAIKKLQDICKK